jgi:hypothetical protein
MWGVSPIWEAPEISEIAGGSAVRMDGTSTGPTPAHALGGDAPTKSGHPALALDARAVPSFLSQGTSAPAALYACSVPVAVPGLGRGRASVAPRRWCRARSSPSPRASTPSTESGTSVPRLTCTCGSTASSSCSPSFAAVADGTSGSSTPSSTRPAIRSASTNAAAFRIPLGVWERVSPMASRRSARLRLLRALTAEPFAAHLTGSAATPSPEWALQ